MISLVRRNLGCKSQFSLSLFLRSFSTSPEREVVYDVLVKKHHFSPEIATAVSSDLSRFRSPEKADSILSFLEENCFWTSQLQSLAKSDPRFLTAAVEDDTKRKINIFKDFGFSTKDVAKVISSNSAILHSSAEKKIAPQLSTLKELLGSNHDVVALVKRSSWYITIDSKKVLLPNIELLKSCGVTRESIRIMMFNFPRCILLKPRVLKEVVEKVKEMGMNPSSKMFVYAVRARASLSQEKWELKLLGFRDMGVSEREVLAMFRKSPSVLCTSLEKLREIRRVVVATGKYGICDLVGAPAAFMYSVEKRCKPRLRILEILERRGLIQKWPPLSSVARMSDDRFFKVFVRPYSDQLGEVFVAFKVSKN